jgi:hypothetical protein
MWRGVLLVEPDIDLLNGETLLLTTSNYCVTPASSNGDLFLLRNTKAVALVILSDRLVTCPRKSLPVEAGVLS